MSVTLVSTKYYLPRLRQGAVSRPGLVERLNRGLDHPGSFIIVSGPAGSGKSTLLSEFASQFTRPVSWLSLDAGDNDPARFWTHLVAACQSVLEGVGESALELCAGSQTLSDDALPSILINDFSAQSKSLVLVLDDYHEIKNPSIHAGLLFLLDHLPPELHILVSTRADPPWPLARYRARGLLAEIRAQDLRFDNREAAQFLNQTMGLAVSADQVAALDERTEGWAAGLQLAALSLQGRADIPAFIKAFTGSHLYVAEYLVEEVLQRQPGEIRDFLLKTSLLERMNAGLCEAVAGCADGQSLLQHLHHANLFVMALDGEGQWFRYHHLFSDLLSAHLRQSFTAEVVADLHMRAAGWYEKHGFIQEAVDHALAAKDFERLAELVERAAHNLIFSGRVSLVRGWLESFPADILQAHPRLGFYQFWIDVLQSKADLSDQSIEEKEALLRALPPSPENDRLRGELMAVVCRATALSGRTASGIRLAKEALAFLPQDDLASRARVNSALAAAHDLEGRAVEAAPVYRESVAQAVSAGDVRLAASTLLVKGLVQHNAGQIHAAADTFREIIALSGRAGGNVMNGEHALRPHSPKTAPIFFPAGQGYIGLGIVNLEWNDLKSAETYLEQGIDLCRRGGLDGVSNGRMHLSRLRQAQGDLAGALEEIQALGQAAERVDDLNLVTRKIQISLAAGEVESAWRLAEPMAAMLQTPFTGRHVPLIFLESLKASIARVHIARGQIDLAVDLLERLRATAEPDQRLSRLIEIDLLRALALQKRAGGSISADAVASLEHALDLAEPQGFVVLFLEEGPALVPLLNVVARGSDVPEPRMRYARRLLEAFGQPAAAQPAGQVVGLVEPLTPREMEVLELIAVGDSNPVIAEKLVITVRTVKKHTGNIYGKLGASSRIHAVARARELGLLSTT